MKRIFLSKSWYVWILLAILLLSALLVAWALVNTDDADQPDTQVAETATIQGGWTAWLDPVTGKLSTEKPPEGEVIPLNDQTMRQFSTSEVDIIPETLPDGTVILNLQGRFRQGSAATINDAGEVKIHRIGGEIFVSPDGREIRQRLHDSDSSASDNRP